MTAYSAVLDNTDGGQGLFPGDYLTSPGGVYFATLLTNGQFVVAQGSNPDLNGAYSNNTVFNTGKTIPSGQNYAYSSVAQSLFGVYAWNNASSGSPVTLFSEGTITQGQTGFLTLSDAGQLALTLGNPSNPGSQVWNNGVNDPVKNINLTSINYGTASATLTPGQQVTNLTVPFTNSTSLTQVNQPAISTTYSQTSAWNFNLSEALTAGVSATASANLGIPDVAEGGASVTVSASETTTFSGGQSNSTTIGNTFSDTVDLTIPPFSQYDAYITSVPISYTLPYTFTGIATYANGNTEQVVGSGTFDGGDSTNFAAGAYCVYYNGVGNPCPEGSTLRPPGTPVPEPATLLLLPVALLAVTGVRLLPVALLAVTGIRGVRLGRRRVLRHGEPETGQHYTLDDGEIPFAAAL